MRNAAIFVLVLAVAALGYLTHAQSVELREARSKIQDLSGSVESLAKTTSLELQEKCSKQAQATFEAGGWKKEQLASYTNHYNEKMNKCFIFIENTTPAPTGVLVTRLLNDAFEGRSYGEYYRRSDKVPPFSCKGNLLSGAEKSCHSEQEFDEIVKLYME